MNDAQLYLCLRINAVYRFRKPVSPSTQAIRMSSTPRFCRSLNTDSQKLAPSLSDKYRPRTSFCLPDSAPVRYKLPCSDNTHLRGFYSEWRPARRRDKPFSGRYCHCFNSGMTLSVTALMVAVETLKAYKSSISRLISW